MSQLLELYKKYYPKNRTMLKSVKEKSKDVALTNYAIEEASFELQEKEPEYSSSKKLEIDFEALVETENQKKLSMKQRLKIVLLKCCFYLSDEINESHPTDTLVFDILYPYCILR